MTNKQRALAFLELVIANKTDEAYGQYVDPNGKHHNAYFRGDFASLKRGMEENGAEFPHKVFEVQHALEDGDFVAVHSRLRLQENMSAMGVLHLFRFQDGLIVEMWDLGQQEPENVPNENGMF